MESEEAMAEPFPAGEAAVTQLLVVSGGPPTEGKPGVTFAPPADPDRVDHQLTIRLWTTECA